MQKWEYKKVETTRRLAMLAKWSDWEPIIDLTQLGDDGWELVSVIRRPMQPGMSGKVDRLQYYFKRTKE